MSINKQNAARLCAEHGDMLAILPEAFEQITQAGEIERPVPQPREIAATGGRTSAKAISLIPILNLLTDCEGYGSGTTYRSISTATKEAVANPRIGKIAYEIYSPGGFWTGLPETAADIAYAGRRKPTIAIVRGLAASAAYFLASQANEIVVSPSGVVGSVGVFSMHADYSRMLDQEGVTVTYISSDPRKVESNPHQPLSDGARSHMQSRVDELYNQFVAAVAKGRRRSEAFVREHFGGGRTVTADDAVARGMVNRIGTFDATVAQLLDPRTDRERRQATIRRRLAIASAWDPEIDA